jgi:hypothetical protein
MADIKTAEEIAAKAAELSVRENAKVTPLCFTNDEGEQVIGFVKEPNREAKMVALNDVLKMNMADAGRTVLDCGLLKEDSDPRILSDDKMYMSACVACFSIVSITSNEAAAQLKKN